MPLAARRTAPRVTSRAIAPLLVLLLLLGGVSPAVADAEPAHGSFAAVPRFGHGGSASVVFNGGSVDQLQAEVRSLHATGAWVQDAGGQFHLLLADGPAFLKAGFSERFPGGFAGATPVTLIQTLRPILTATQPWELNALSEPAVLYEDGVWRLWYRGGWGANALGYATSTDTIEWTKHSVTPLLGLGAGGFQGQVAQPFVTRVGPLLHLYFSDGDGEMHVATSSDGFAWSVQPGNAIVRPADVRWWGNRFAWLDQGRWRMLLEGGGPDPWRVYLATSEDGFRWSLSNGGRPLTSLAVIPGWSYGGPWLSSTTPGRYVVWYQASEREGYLPTNIYRSTSPDLINWTTPEVMLRHQGTGSFAFDQVADPRLVVVGDRAYMFYDGDDNRNGTAALGLVVLPANLATVR